MNIKEHFIDESKARELAKKYKINLDIVKLLLGRGVKEETMPLLVSKNILPLIDNQLTNVDIAAQIINKYLVNNDATIYIFGDYDSDGVNATYIMYTALTELAEALESNVTIKYYLPERTEGYGLNINWCKSIVRYDDTLVVTVDNGITRIEEVEYLQSKGVEVIVTDHHQPQIGLIPKCTIVDAHLHDTNNENACGLCGAAVAFKVIEYLYKEIHGYDHTYLEKYVAHVGIATITDVMPFTDENIIFVNNTIKYLNNYPYDGEDYIPVTEPIYFYADFNKDNNITPKDIAFGLGPQINSCGRMGDINIAMDYMLSTNEEDLFCYYNAMDTLNTIRKQKTRELTASIEPPKPTDLSLIIKLDNAEGIAGSIASNLCSTYNMPVIVFSGDKNNMTGSARCPECYNVISLFQKTDYILGFGGHSAAAGVTIKAEDFDKFKESFNKAISKEPVITNIDTSIYVDRILETKDINRYTIEKYNNVLFFNEFIRPVYGFKSISITGYHTSKSNPNNICFHIKNGNKSDIKLWCWGFGDTYKAMGEPKLVDITGTLEVFKGMNVINILNIEKI